MYCEFYQLTERPFNVTPDPKFLYLNARYREAIASLNYGITQRKGFITLIGEAGTGKTTLLKKLLEDLDPKTKSVFIFNTNVSFEEILEYIFAEFDLPVHNGKKLYMLQRLNAFLLEELRGGGNVALLIDEAQDLEFSVLEDLRLLSNLETAKEKILQIVLSGQPELGQKLSNPILRQLRQRIGINCRLLPLSRDEITEYIHYRLQAAGSPDLKLFTREAEDQIYHFSRGIPRLVNVVCDNALVIGYALGKKRIGADVIGEAAADLLPAEPPIEVTTAPIAPVVTPASAPARPRTPRRGRIGLTAFVAAAVLIIGFWSLGRTTLNPPPEAAPVVQVAPPAALEVIRPGSESRLGESQAGLNQRPALRVEREVPVPIDARPLDSVAAKPAAAAIDDAQRAAHESEVVTAPARRQQDPARALPTDETAPPSGREIATDSAGSVVTARRAPAVAVSPEFPGDKGQRSGQDAAKTWAGSAPESARVEAPPVHEPAHLDSSHFEQLVVRDGDSISEIARRKYGQSSYTVLDLLKMANPEIADVDIIAPGQTLRLPELRDGFPVLTEGGGRYSLLVFSTPNQARAAALAKALRGRGFDAQTSFVTIGAEKQVYRVTVNGVGDRESITTVGRELQKLFREDTRMAQLGE